METFEHHHKTFCKLILDGLATGEYPEWFNILNGLCTNFERYIGTVISANKTKTTLSERASFHLNMSNSFHNNLLLEYGDPNHPFNMSMHEFFHEPNRYQNFRRLEHLRKFGSLT